MRIEAETLRDLEDPVEPITAEPERNPPRRRRNRSRAFLASSGDGISMRGFSRCRCY